MSAIASGLALPVVAVSGRCQGNVAKSKVALLRRPSGNRRRPCVIGFGPEKPKGWSADQMALDVEGVEDRRVDGEKSLGRGLGVEPLRLSLSSSDRQVGVLGAIVLPKPARSVQMPEIQDIERCAI